MANIIIAKIGIVNMRFHGIVNEDIVADRGIAFVLKGVLPVMDLLESREFIRAIINKTESNNSLFFWI